MVRKCFYLVDKPVLVSYTIINVAVKPRLLTIPAMLIAITVICFGIAGCRNEQSKTPQVAELSDVEFVRNSIAVGDWEAAWERSDSVLLQASDDPELLELMAQVAFQTGRITIAADLLVDATRLDKYESSARFNQAFTGLLSAGRLFDGIDLLRDGVTAMPDAIERRRLLFDMLVTTEQHLEADSHRQRLIRSRAIDRDLMLAPYRYEKRNEETESLTEIVARNPNDPRPLMGRAKLEFDGRDNDNAISTLRSIVTAFPDFVAAQVMLGRVMIDSGEFAGLDAWANTLPNTMAEDPDFWLICGDWALHRNDLGLAVTCYGLSARLGADRVEPWSKLAAMISQISEDPVECRLIQDRATSLQKLRRGYVGFKAMDFEAAGAIVDITDALMLLGRPWEAEAWAAYGTTLALVNESDRSLIVKRREQILSQLRVDTPWQLPGVMPSWSWLEALGMDEVISRLTGRASQESQVADTLLKSDRRAVRPTSPTTRPLLVNEAMKRGLQFSGHTASDLDQPGILTHQMIGCGGGAIDFDLDGWPDVYLIAAGGTPPHADSSPNAMFRNLSGQFKEVSSVCGGDDRGFGQGVAVGDLNEDGFDDLLVLNYGPNSVWINNGDGTLTDHSSRWIPSYSSWSTSAAIADINSDGLSDIFIANYCSGLEPSIEKCFAGVNRDVRTCSPTHFSAEPDLALKGTPEGRLVDQTKDWNAIPNVLGRGLGIVAGSFDGRQGIDLLIANDMTSNHYWSRSISAGPNDVFKLEESASLRGLATDAQSRSQGSMGIAVSDLNRDGDVDFYITNFEREHNTLCLSRGEYGWRDQTSQEKLRKETLPWVGFGTQAVDFDNNGTNEILVLNGHVDHFKNSGGVSDYEQPAQLFQRGSSGVFESVGSEVQSRYFESTHVGRALWSLDVNKDGRTDVVATHQTEPVAMLMNSTSTPNSFITLFLVGTDDARCAVGAVITARSGDDVSTSVLTSGDGFLCSNERCVRIGLGDNSSGVDISIRWLNGEEQQFQSLLPGQNWLMVQGEPAFALFPTDLESTRRTK